MNRPHTKAASGDSSSVTKAVSGDNRNVPTASQSNLTTGSDDKTAAGGEASCEQGFSKTAISTLLTQSATIIPPTSTTDSSKNNNDDSEMKKGETGTPIGENTGNDRVTMDKANRPLVPESGSRTAKTSSANGFERSGAVQEISTNPESKSSPPTATSATALPAKKPETTTLRSVLPQPSSKSDCPSPQIIAAMKELQTPSAAPVVASSSTQGKLSMLPNASATAAAGAVGADYPDEYAKIEEALKKQRKPLTDLFSPYVSASDTSLGDARTRLRIALDQTRQLRAAFTERVYGKYRVCLKPPPQTEDILDALKKDPKGMLQKLQHEIKQTKLEKEFEKKEAQRLNHQPGSTVEQPTLPSKLTVNASSTASSCTGASTLADGSSFDNSDDLMFVTGGLSLVVLPESDASRIDMSMYQERAPIHPETRQRVRSISAAAAAAGEAMLEKARRGQSLRTEREKRRQDQYAGGEIMERDEYFDGNYAHHARPSDIRRPIVVATAKPLPSLLQTAVKKGTPASQSSKKMIVTTAKASEGEKKAKRPSTGKAIKSASGQSPAISTAASIKAIRARVQANMSLNTLLSLDAADEELRTDGKFSAATKAIFERGVGIPPTSNPSKGSQSRIRHPFPDSLGGRRRFVGSSSTGSRAPIISSPTDVLLALPPKPTSKERRRFKKISVLETPVATSPRAKSAIRRVVKQFTIPPATTLEQGDYRPRKKRITEIEFMRGVHLNKQAAITAKTDGNTKKFGGSMRDGRTQDIDHMLVVNVLNAVGLVATSLRDDEIRKFDFPGSFSTPIFDEDRLRSFGLPVDAGPFSQSISKVKAFRKKFTSINRSCTDAFCSEQAEKEGSNSGKALPTTEHERKAGATKGHILTSTTTSIAAVVNLRGGGGDGGKDPSGGDERSNQSSESAAEIGPGGSAIRGPHGDVAHRSATMSNSMNSSIHPDLNTHRVVWDERSQQPLILVHTPMVRSGAVLQGHAGHLQAQLHPAEQYHQTNALQLAHQLHMSRLPHHGHQAAGDLAEYIGGLHQQQAQAAYGWSSVRAVSAAASSSPHSLAALAISQHRAAMVPMTVQERQDRTRVLLAREQQSFAAHAAATQRHQAVALLGGTAGAPIQAYASPGYPHHAGQLLNSSTAALLAHPGIQNSPIFPSAQHAAAQNSQSTTDNVQQVQQNDSDFVVSAESTNCHDAQKEGKINRGHLQTVVVCEDEQRNERGPTAPVVQKKDIVLPSEARNKRKSVENGNDESNAGKKPRVSDLGDTKNPCVSVSQGSCIFSDTVKPHGVDDNAILHEDLNGSDEKVNHSHGIQSGLQSPTEPSADVHVENSPPKVASSGLQYFVPSAPAGISSNMATLILSARCHEAIQILGAPEVLAAEGSRLVEYIVSVGTAVPIPKTMVLNLVKDRMNAPAFKSGGICSIPALSRDVIVAVILLWLWRNQEDSFQRAFSKSGRIDVDPECKWFVTAAVEKAVSAVAAEVADLSSRSNTPLASAILAHKSKNSAVQKGGEADPFSATSTRIDLLAAAIVNKALNSGLVIDEETNSAVANFHDLVDYLDELRKLALYGKSQERALLGAFVSRNSTMSVNFSHAYVSAMVRAGEALGHGELFEVVQNERVHVSTMIPYDVFTDESGAWEDPCRPAIGFTNGLTGNDMVRRAHARAMIQKSLKKLQDRHNVKGGTSLFGPYVEANPSGSDGSKAGSTGTPRGTWQKRRSSFSELQIQPGSGSAVATSWTLYDPKYQSPALEWDSDDMDNTPYGRHDKNTRPRSLSHGQGAALLRQSGKDKGLRRQGSGRIVTHNDQPLRNTVTEKEEESEARRGLRRSTREIAWRDVAGIFQRVQLPGAVKDQKEKDVSLTPKDRTIFAPYVRKLGSLPMANQEESDEDEDLTDETILSRHQVVLDRMKAKLLSDLESRKRNQDRRKSRVDKSTK